MSRPVGETVGRRAFIAGAEDAHGQTGESWADAVDVEIYAFDPGSSSEPREPGTTERVVTEPTIYYPPTTTFTERDLVVVRGKTYEVAGDPREWIHPTKSFHGFVATLRRVTG